MTVRKHNMIRRQDCLFQHLVYFANVVTDLFKMVLCRNLNVTFGYKAKSPAITTGDSLLCILSRGLIQRDSQHLGLYQCVQ